MTNKTQGIIWPESEIQQSLLQRRKDRMSEKTNASGIGFCGLLVVLFIGLKLCHVIDWSWLWVTAPMWAPLAFLLSAYLTLCVVVAFKQR